ncbi:hypothetical protein KFE80_04240 [bacterium SCSIO 12696]|nr:hypothetical protein KFE80_04240 [bacterium SCSIO 12696]
MQFIAQGAKNIKFKHIWTLIVSTFSCSISAGIVSQCEIIGQVVSEPKETADDEFIFLFKGTMLPSQDFVFCGDRLGKTEEILITKQYYKKLGSPKFGDDVTLRELKEENDFGHGLMQWRYFDLDVSG